MTVTVFRVRRQWQPPGNRSAGHVLHIHMQAHKNI